MHTWCTASGIHRPRSASGGIWRHRQGSAFVQVTARFAGVDLGAPGRNRTCDTRFRKPMLYPLSYGGVHAATCAGTGEPATGQGYRTGRLHSIGCSDLAPLALRRLDRAGRGPHRRRSAEAR